jgi:hypothetical protein
VALICDHFWSVQEGGPIGGGERSLMHG